MRVFPSAIVVAIAALAWPSAHAAGVVEVSFVEPDKFADIGRGDFDIARNTTILADHLKGLAKLLPNGQTLKIDVLDIDLAGEVWPASRTDLRILRGRADWPAITLRYTLTADGRTLSSGEERITDMNYMFLTLRPSFAEEPLAHDRRMLEQWFSKRFLTTTKAANN